ncbi:MAG: 16S rRNA (cytosine(1402)-N(4))-methyltransferase RsmH [Candidatus Babeliales bacterium]
MKNKKTELAKPYHIPVLVQEVLTYLDPKPGKVYVDATFGGGGHTKAILEKEPSCTVIAMDWDLVALEKNGDPLLEHYPDNLKLIWSNFSQIDMKLKKEGIGTVDGILADFGTSQYQLTEREGFSFATDTPLDMRMSPAHQKTTAAHVVNKATEQELLTIFKELGEEPKSRAIARLICAERKKKRIITTKQLVDLIEKVCGPKRGKKIHPATKIFQALRIYVNRELENIIAFLPAALRALKPEGRLVCISFHSLEDRLVKQFFRDKAQSGEGFESLTPKAVLPSDQEIAINPASRSARLRALKVK